MALKGKDNIVDEETATSHGTVVNSHALKVIQELQREKATGQEDAKQSKGKESTNTLAFYKLFSFADPLDYLLMIIGTISAAANGSCLPLLTYFFGDVVNAFGQNENNKRILHAVSVVHTFFLSVATIAYNLALFFSCYVIHF